MITFKSYRDVVKEYVDKTLTDHTLDEETKRWIKIMLKIADEDREILDALKDDKI